MKAIKKLPQINNGRSGSVSGFDEADVTLLRRVSMENNPSFFTALESNEQGLGKAEIEEKKRTFGLNEMQHEKVPALYVQLFQAFLNPFIAVLIILASVSFIMDVLMAAPGEQDYKTVIVVGVMVMLSSLLRFWQEYTSNRAAEELKSMVKTTATVLRQDKGKFEINIIDLVPGDVVFLSAGDMIPADCRIIGSKDLFVSQAICSGIGCQPIPESGGQYQRNIQYVVQMSPTSDDYSGIRLESPVLHVGLKYSNPARGFELYLEQACVLTV